MGSETTLTDIGVKRAVRAICLHGDPPRCPDRSCGGFLTEVYDDDTTAVEGVHCEGCGQCWLVEPALPVAVAWGEKPWRWPRRASPTPGGPS